MVGGRRTETTLGSWTPEPRDSYMLAEPSAGLWGRLCTQPGNDSQLNARACPPLGSGVPRRSRRQATSRLRHQGLPHTPSAGLGGRKPPLWPCWLLDRAFQVPTYAGTHPAAQEVNGLLGPQKLCDCCCPQGDTLCLCLSGRTDMNPLLLRHLHSVCSQHMKPGVYTCSLELSPPAKPDGRPQGMGWT